MLPITTSNPKPEPDIRRLSGRVGPRSSRRTIISKVELYRIPILYYNGIVNLSKILTYFLKKYKTASFYWNTLVNVRTYVYVDGINIVWIQSWDRTYRFAGSLAPYIIQPFRHPPKKGVQSPKAFTCLTSQWMIPMHGYSHTHINVWVRHM